MHGLNSSICSLLFFGFLQTVSAQETISGLIQKSNQFYEEYELVSAWLFATKAEKLSREKNDVKSLIRSKIIQTNIQIENDKLDEAEKNAIEIQKLAKQNLDKFSESVAQMQLGQVHLYRNQFDKSIPFFESAIQSYFSKNPSPEAALAYNDYGYSLGKLGKPERQIESLLNALRIHESLQPIDNSEMAVVLNNLSTAYLGLSQFDKAIDFAKRSIEFREKSEDIDKMALAYCNISQLYRNKDLNEAEFYREKCVELAEKSDNVYRLVQSYITSALIFSDKKEIEKAIEFEKKAISVIEKNDLSSGLLASRYLALSMHTNSLNQNPEETQNYLEKSKELALKLNDRPLLREIYFQYHNFYKTQKNYEKALESYRTFSVYRDSIINENTKSNIAELETKYETEKKDNQIHQLSTDQKIQQLQIEKQMALIAGNELEAERKEKEIQLLSQEKELQELRIGNQNEVIEKQRLLSLSNQQKLQIAEQEKIIQNKKLRNSKIVQYLIFGVSGLTLLLGYILFNRYQLKRTIKEQKKLLGIRENIAKDLHDEIGSTLTSIKILSEVSEKNWKMKSRKFPNF